MARPAESGGISPPFVPPAPPRAFDAEAGSAIEDGTALLRVAGLLAFPLGLRLRRAVGSLHPRPGARVIVAAPGPGACPPGLAEAFAAWGGRRLAPDRSWDSGAADGRPDARGGGPLEWDLLGPGARWPPVELDGVLFLFSLVADPRRDTRVRSAALALRNRGRVAVLDFVDPADWPWVLRRIPVPPGLRGAGGGGGPLEFVSPCFVTLGCTTHLPGATCLVVAEAR